MGRNFRYKALLAFAGLMLAGTAAQAELVVVVGADSSVGQLSADQVSQLFLGKTSSFPGGQKAEPVDQPEGSTERDEFHSKVTGKAPAQLNAYWSKLIFTGKGQPPKQVDAAELKKLLASNPNAIGYLDSAKVDGSLKVVLKP